MTSTDSDNHTRNGYEGALQDFALAAGSFYGVRKTASWGERNFAKQGIDLRMSRAEFERVSKKIYDKSGSRALRGPLIPGTLSIVLTVAGASFLVRGAKRAYQASFPSSPPDNVTSQPRDGSLIAEVKASKKNNDTKHVHRPELMKLDESASRRSSDTLLDFGLGFASVVGVAVTASHVKQRLEKLGIDFDKPDPEVRRNIKKSMETGRQRAIYRPLMHGPGLLLLGLVGTTIFFFGRGFTRVYQTGSQPRTAVSAPARSEDKT